MSYLWYISVQNCACATYEGFNQKPRLYFFHADWCDHCQHFKPHVLEFKNTNECKSVDFIELDADESHSKTLARDFKVTGLPTIVYEHMGNIKHFNGERSVAGLQEFVHQCFKSTPETNNADTAVNTSASTLSLDAVKAAAVSAEKPYVVKSKMWFFHADWCTHCQTFKPIVVDFVNQYGSSIEFISVNDKDEGANAHHQRFNIKGFPTIVGEQVDGTIHHYNGDRTLDSLIMFANTLTNMVAPQEVAPQEVAPQEVAPQEVAPQEVAPQQVASNVSNNTGDNQEPSMFFFHADWCGHCQDFKPQVEKFKTYPQMQHINFVDCNDKQPHTDNLIREFGIQGFPTIVLKKPNGQVVFFNKARTAQGLAEFLDEEL